MIRMRISAHFTLKMIGMVIGAGLLDTKYIQGLRWAGFSPEVDL